MLENLVTGGQRFLLIDILTDVAIAFVLGTAVTLVYRRTHRGLSYSTSFVQTLIFLPMVASIVMLLIGNNLARACGLVGAMSIIRFRTVIKDSRDTAFIFLGLAAGMAAGTGYHMIALAGTGFVLLMIFGLHRGQFGRPRAADLLLRFSVIPDERGAMFHEAAFRTFLRKSTLMNVQTRNGRRSLELSYFVRLRDPGQHREFVGTLGSIEGVEGVTLISAEE